MSAGGIVWIRRSAAYIITETTDISLVTAPWASFRIAAIDLAGAAGDRFIFFSKASETYRTEHRDNNHYDQHCFHCLAPLSTYSSQQHITGRREDLGYNLRIQSFRHEKDYCITIDTVIL
jgi:hypothetical protein